MYTKPTPRIDQQSLFFDLESQLNQKHPLYLLANKIGWDVFEEAYTCHYFANYLDNHILKEPYDRQNTRRQP